MALSITKKEDFNKLIGLLYEIPWLTGYRESLVELLMDFCDSEDHWKLLHDMLKRFEFFDSGKRCACWTAMASQIVTMWHLDPRKTQIVAMTNDSRPDSSQSVLQMLKGPLSKLDTDYIKVNRLDLVEKHITNCPNIVLVDEFMGSGDSAVRNIAYIKTILQKQQLTQYQIKLCVVAAMEHAMPRIEQENVEMYAYVLLKKGISGYYAGEELEKYKRIMLGMESKLDQKDGSLYFPFGYKQSEALYGADEGNAVNNLFPIFWWKHMVGRGKRPTMFARGS
jgi:hypothetical protein